jgi:hypothetical protein
MKTAHVLVAILALAACVEGCKKRESKPAPQVVQATAPATPGAGAGAASTNASGTPPHPDGMSWFQGGLEEGFSRATSRAAPAGMDHLRTMTEEEGSSVGTAGSLSWLIQLVRLGL